MEKHLTDITIVLDRSGSMGSCKEEAENGLNHFVKKQKKEEGEAFLTLLQFDTEHEFVYKGIPIKDVKKFKLEPRGMTALLDAVGKSINETSQRIKKMKKKDRPDLVIVLIITDGWENASHEFTRSQIRDMIKKQSKNNWQFIFQGADQNAFAEAKAIGGTILASVSVNYSSSKTLQAISGSSCNVSRMREASRKGKTVVNYYTNEEKTSML